MKIHLDLDCYFVSAERTRYPFLKGKCVVVAKGSDKKIFSKSKKDGAFLGKTGAFNSILEFPNHFDKSDVKNSWKKEFIDEKGVIHGIVVAKSYEAKAYKIKTGTPLKDALVMCKDLYVLPGDHLFYQMLSQELKAYLDTKIPVLEQYSIDEFFGDLNGFVKDEDTLSYITELQREILEKFDLPISIGASRSKWIAKLITDKVKPYGVRVVKQHDVNEFIKDIPIRDFPGIGKNITKKLHEYKIHTLGDIQNSPNLLISHGKVGRDLYHKICGTDDEEVSPKSDRKGIAISRNFAAIQDRDEIYRRAGILARYLSYSIIKLKLNPTSFFFKIRYADGTKKSHSVTENRLFNEKFLINLAIENVKKLDIYPDTKIHYIGINATNFADTHNMKTFSLIDFKEDKKNSALTEQVAKMREKYGVDIIKYANEER